MLSQDTLERDGYANHEEALADLKNFYPYLTMESDVIAISFEPLGYSISFEDQPLIDARDVAFPAW
ncbi:MAG TPA: hypothetical protein DEB13_00765 [Candidatus Yanofskybacteria bacterium]|nr:hypothetical protein [Candidatus Yanofskybacteria bacterium]